MKVGLIGYGYWGEILYKKLEKFCDVKFTCRSKDTYIDKLDDVDWVVVATPDKTHYEIVKKCLWAGKNVFCEKPLTPTYEQSEKLFRLAEMRNVKLYVDDVQNWRVYDFEILEHNLVERRKSGGGNIKDILYQLTYHDIYFLYEHIKYCEIENIIPIDLDNKLQFKVKFNDISIEFIYDLNYNYVEHYINGCNLRSKEDVLYKMLFNVLNEKVDFNHNKKISLFTNRFIDNLNVELFGESK